MNFKLEEEPMQTDVGTGFVLYTGGAQGTDQLAEDLGSAFWRTGRSPHPPRTFQESYHYSHVPSVVGSGQCAYRRGGRETRQTGAHRFLHSSFDTAQLRNCPEGSHRVRFWYTGRRRQTSLRGYWVVRAIGFGSRQKSLSV